MDTAPQFSISVVAEAPTHTIAAAKSADEGGFDCIYVGDIQSTHREMYTSLTLVAANSARIQLGPGVTNPVTRHPAVTAAAIATLDEISGGRAFLGIGTGDSAVHNIGRPSATLAETETYLRTVQRLWRDGHATHHGDAVIGRRWERRIPILFSAHGPRALRMAGRVADGVIAGVGMTPEAVDYVTEHVAEGAADSGRRLSDIAVWHMAYPALGPTAQVRDQVGAVLAAGGNLLAKSAAMCTVPDRLRSRFGELAASYDYSGHVDSHRDSPNSQLVRRLGLTDYLVERFGLVGEPHDVRDVLVSHHARSVQRYWMIYSRPDLQELITGWSEDVIRPLRSSSKE